MAAGKRGAPGNRGKPHPFQITVPQPVYDYLGFLAQNSIFGLNESEVASAFVQAKVEELLRESFHEKRIPKPSEPREQES